MTGVTGTGLEGIVSQGLDQTVPFCNVGIMTFTAIQSSTGLAQMPRQEGVVIAIVAVEAHSGNRRHQQGNLVAAVRVVAIETIPVGRRSVGAAGRHFLLQILVTQEAEPTRSLNQQSGQVSGMRQMASRALTVDKGGVLAARPTDGQIDIMALGTKSTLVVHQQTLGSRSVRQMAGAAFPVFIGHVHHFPGRQGVTFEADRVLLPLQ